MKTKQTTMQIWEYTTLRISGEAVTEIDGRKTSSMFEAKPTLHETLNDFGQDGCEVVGVISGKTSSACRVILKRAMIVGET